MAERISAGLTLASSMVTKVSNFPLNLTTKLECLMDRNDG